MGILRLLAIGAAGVVAYKAWQKRQAGTDAAAEPDTGDVTAPHGDQTFAEASPDVLAEPSAPGTQSSRGFGE